MKTFKELLTKMKDCKKAIEKQQIMDAFEDYWKNVKDAKVLAKEIKEKWTSELLECDDCCYSYRSVHPKGLYNLECPNCGNLSSHKKH